MMSGHGANPICFNKKRKIGRPEHSLTLTPKSDNISFLPYLPHHPQSGRHMCITPKMKMIILRKFHFGGKTSFSRGLDKATYFLRKYKKKKLFSHSNTVMEKRYKKRGAEF